MKLEGNIKNMDLFRDLADVLEDYVEASEKFINKVDTGRAKSVETYNDLKRCTIKAKNVIEDIREKD